MTISADEAIARARLYAEERGWTWREPVRVTPLRRFPVFGRVTTYEVWSNAECKGMNARVIVAADDGTIIKGYWLPR
jgi:hypothetical protein